jgi:hypothetical protein
LGKGIGIHFVQRRSFEVVKKRLCNGITKMVFKRLAVEYVVSYENLCTLYREENIQKMAMPCGNVLDKLFWLGL